MLTTTKINDTLKIAYCKLATKTLSYIKKLSFGIKDKCSLKQLSLLRAYTKALENHEIVGNLSSCCCSLKGEFNVNVLENLEYQFQFLPNGSGSLFDTLNLYNFNWGLDSNTNVLYLNFPDIYLNSYFEGTFLTLNSSTFFQDETRVQFNPGTEIYYNALGFPTIEEFVEDFNLNNTAGMILNYTDDVLSIIYNSNLIENENIIILINDSGYPATLSFNEGVNLFLELSTLEFDNECNFTYIGEFPWNYLSSVEITNPLTPNNTESEYPPKDFTINIKNNLEVVILTKTYSGYNTYQEIVDLWNSDPDCADYHIELDSTGNPILNFNTFFGTNYTNYTAEFQQYENGFDAFWASIINPLAFIGSGLVSVVVDSVVIYNESTIEFTSVEDFVLSFNELNTSQLTMTYDGVNTLGIYSPANSFTAYNLFPGSVTSYILGFDEYTGDFGDGVDPDLITYSNEFIENNEELIFNTTNPCSPKVIEQTCLSNNDVENIINHINKM